ncbi:MAG: glycerol kinase GlpK [Cytophagales bacterium]
MQNYILALDQGTTSSRAIVFDKFGQVKSMAQKEFKQIFPQPGWVEHDPNEIWSTQASVAAEATVKLGINGTNLKAIGITNQRETTIVWNRNTGEPIYNAIVWQDRRTAVFCDQLKKDGIQDLIRGKTGLVIDAYFSASKINWLLENVAGARKQAENGELAFGTVDTWLVWKFTRGKVHVTDVTNASRTMLFNIQTQTWDDELLKIFNIPHNILPEVKQSSEVYGETATTIFASKVPIAGIAGDQHAALFGQMCIDKAMVKNTYGTGCFMLMNIGDNFISSKNNLLTTVAWKIEGKIQYAFEGSIFIGGAVVQWLRDGLGIIKSASEIEKLAASVPDTAGVYFVPAFAGLGAPYWKPNARGTILGITRGTTSAHIARAAIESIAFQTMDVLNAMQADAGFTIKELRVDGGATQNDMMMQFQANLLDCKVIRPKVLETTALGAAYLAGLAVGYWQNVEEINKLWQIEKVFEPIVKTEALVNGIKSWQKAIKTAQIWAE